MEAFRLYQQLGNTAAELESLELLVEVRSYASEDTGIPVMLELGRLVK